MLIRIIVKMMVMMMILFVRLFVFFSSSSTTRLSRTGPKTECLTILRAATLSHETELVDHDFCLSQSHYTDDDDDKQ